MNNHKLLKELTNAGIVNNLANRFFQTVLIIGPIMGILAAASEVNPKYLSIKYLTVYIIFVQTVFAFIIFILGEPTNKGWETGNLKNKILISKYYQTNKTQESKLEDKINFLKSYFSKYWSYVWGTWAVLYLIMFIVNYNKLDNTSDNASFSIVGDIALEMLQGIATYFNSFFILRLYFALIHKFDSHKITHDSSIDFYKYSHGAFFILILLVVAQLTIYLSMETQNILTMENVKIVQLSFKIANGLIASICFILLISRLIGSFTTELPYKNILLPFLYLYCSIQPLYFTVNDEAFNKYSSFCLLLIALFGKYLLYVSITWLFETKRILFHFLETHQLRNDMKDEIVLFDEIWIETDSATLG